MLYRSCWSRSCLSTARPTRSPASSYRDQVSIPLPAPLRSCLGREAELQPLQDRAAHKQPHSLCCTDSSHTIQDSH